MNESKRELAPIIQGFVPGLPEIGKIKIGKKGEWKKSAKGREFQPPQKLDHFIITKFDRDDTGNFLIDDALMKTLMARKKSVNDKGNIVNIPIMFIYNDIAPNFMSRFTCYHGKTLWCYGDGNVAYRLDKDGRKQEVSCPCERCTPEHTGDDVCKPYGILSVIIRGANTIGGVWKFRTTSYFNCRNIPSSMLFVKALTGGQLAKIPLDLIIEPQVVTLRDGKQSKIYLVKLVYTEGDIDQLAETGYKLALNDQYRVQRMEALEGEARKLITAETESPDDDMLDEFHPEGAEVRDAERTDDTEKPQEKPVPKLPDARTEDVESDAEPNDDGETPDYDPSDAEPDPDDMPDDAEPDDAEQGSDAEQGDIFGDDESGDNLSVW
jgi:hypothetical protein